MPHRERAIQLYHKGYNNRFNKHFNISTFYFSTVYGEYVPISISIDEANYTLNVDTHLIFSRKLNQVNWIYELHYFYVEDVSAIIQDGFTSSCVFRLVQLVSSYLENA